ncbi:hypothetical protein IB238_12555 [Rhizobium sp. ARZ01]|uniref:hypothetical protein n=1 Tax=Rhizobium sp. ARZ01 TaxID=2769313 RepID=UPI0017835E92|nr:hypothetical protein [Rhizobium sp. ARZ01]MBD9373451.1 hypothetical protein [Rhizobium sp. ARZ01]
MNMGSIRVAVVVKTFPEMVSRLEVKRTSREALLEVVDAVVAARADSTDYDPYGTPGWRGWQMGTRRCREMHVGLDGWVKDDADQVPSIVNREIGLRIIVCNTDDGTCVDDPSRSGPQNRSKKGAATDRAVSGNQGSFLDILEASVSENVVAIASKRKSPPPIVTYYLCVFADGDDIRAELSCPSSVNSGYFEHFSERIFILGGEAEPPLPVRRKKDDNDDGSDYPITVKRK